MSIVKLNAKHLRNSNPTNKDLSKVARNPIVFVLDRIIDTYNTGSLFRLADAVAAEKMYLAGDMEYPPNSRIHKAAVGTESWVPWEKTASTIETVQKLKKEGYYIVAIEQSPQSTSYHLLSTKNIKFPVAIVIGNESYGIENDVLKLCDIIVELPMHGINISFNTWGCAAVVAYKVLEGV
ncbi:TrmH family RNA methyltransferase [Candidatus Woesebacteria bacterium]|nr:MAG: TrmH family RNA methyltransferase [Candidatus Woesebacteria bacterium]